MRSPTTILIKVPQGIVKLIDLNKNIQGNQPQLHQTYKISIDNLKRKLGKIINSRIIKIFQVKLIKLIKESKKFKPIRKILTLILSPIKLKALQNILMIRINRLVIRTSKII